LKLGTEFEIRTSSDQSLLAIFEHLLLIFNITASQNLFVSHFKQIIINFYKNQSTNLVDFLDWWETEGANLSVVVEESANKIKVMTIHKSKGLEFPVVLMPFCNWTFKTNLHKNYIWVRDASIQEGILFPIKTTSNLENSIYSAPYLREIKLNWMDNINQLYVAFTRAKEVLIATCPYEKKGRGDISTAAKLIQEVLTRNGESIVSEEDFCFEKGALTDLPAPQTKEVKTAEALNLGDTFHQFHRPEIDSKFSSESVKVGNLVHQAMFYLDNNEAQIAFTKAASENNYSVQEMETARMHFFNIISDESQFGQWLKNAVQTWNEQTFYFDNQELRPDKIIELKEKFVVIDFKTGETKTSYHNQMKQYLRALTAMDIQKPEEGYLFYTETGLMDFISVGG